MLRLLFSSVICGSLTGPTRGEVGEGLILSEGRPKPGGGPGGPKGPGGPDPMTGLGAKVGGLGEGGPGARCPGLGGIIKPKGAGTAGTVCWKP